MLNVNAPAYICYTLAISAQYESDQNKYCAVVSSNKHNTLIIISRASYVFSK